MKDIDPALRAQLDKTRLALVALNKTYTAAPGERLRRHRLRMKIRGMLDEIYDHTRAMQDLENDVKEDPTAPSREGMLYSYVQLKWVKVVFYDAD